MLQRKVIFSVTILHETAGLTLETISHRKSSRHSTALSMPSRLAISHPRRFHIERAVDCSFQLSMPSRLAISHPRRFHIERAVAFFAMREASPDPAPFLSVVHDRPTALQIH